MRKCPFMLEIKPNNIRIFIMFSYFYCQGVKCKFMAFLDALQHLNFQVKKLVLKYDFQTCHAYIFWMLGMNIWKLIFAIPVVFNRKQFIVSIISV